MPTFRIEIETVDIENDYQTGWDVHYKKFDNFEDASGWAYDKGDKSYYKIYERMNNDSLRGYHWEKRT